MYYLIIIFLLFPLRILILEFKIILPSISICNAIYKNVDVSCTALTLIDSDVKRRHGFGAGCVQLWIRSAEPPWEWKQQV